MKLLDIIVCLTRMPKYILKIPYNSHENPYHRIWTGPRFTNGFSIEIQIWWKFRFTLTPILIQWSLQNFVHGTRAVLSWQVQQFVAIWWPATELQQGEISIEFELRAKYRWWNRPFASHSTTILLSCDKHRWRLQQHIMIYAVTQLDLNKMGDILLTLKNAFPSVQKCNFDWNCAEVCLYGSL